MSSRASPSLPIIDRTRLTPIPRVWGTSVLTTRPGVAGGQASREQAVSTGQPSEVGARPEE